MSSSFKAGILAAILTSSGLATAAELPQQLETCAALRRDSERLLCYDKAVAQIKAGVQGAPAPSPENMFGATGGIAPPSAAVPEAKREELRQITASVTSTRRGENGLLFLDLDNGQAWHQQDVDVTLVVNVGDSVTVQRAAFGTFRITDKRGRSARFKRVR
jgi:hypothetical protein